MKTIVLLALYDEAPDLVDLPFVFYTGVGKVNAVVALLKKNFNPIQITCGVIINLSFLPGEQLLRDHQIDLMSLETY